MLRTVVKEEKHHFRKRGGGIWLILDQNIDPLIGITSHALCLYMGESN